MLAEEEKLPPLEIMQIINNIVARLLNFTYMSPLNP
jgi:hypothetical protein